MKKIIKAIIKCFRGHHTIGYCTDAETAKIFKSVFDTMEFEKI